MGSFAGTGDVNLFLKHVAAEIANAAPSVVFPARYIEHVAYAVDMVASNDFTSSPAAIASLYLATRFEFYFRILSGKLNADGKWKTLQARADAQEALGDCRLKSERVSSVALAYRVMKTDRLLVISRRCAELDAALYPAPAMPAGPGQIGDIGDRIQFGRHAAGHGHWGDISAEGLFYALMTAVVFYSQCNVDRGEEGG
jgi:hypothetical protein